MALCPRSSHPLLLLLLLQQQLLVSTTTATKDSDHGAELFQQEMLISMTAAATDSGRGAEQDVGRCCTGMPGIPGNHGIPGNPGPIGPLGRDGRDGHDGQPGKNGKKGDRGDDGVQGDKGSAGETGFPGKMGPMGPAGERGDRGPQGEKGDKGEVPAATPRSAFTVGLSVSNPRSGSPITFSKAMYKEQNHYNTLTGKFTCHFPGVYYFDYHLTGGSGTVRVSLRRNGQAVQFKYSSVSGHYSLSGSSVLRLTKGDEVWLQTESSHIKVYTDSSTDSTFSGFLLYPDLPL
ncbi:complement C1q and tumor necrosis factor-related protein 9-like [Lethenteron reissneri]|uniref:complement C1q and tumor necrosis factor-related protein 9-like n=1 Tax=Lethenteron reissneri TaxID=7753 RepID=UPI002AB61739|nr:complement C1q and tumor necrosis factor-related protein 9-like [Lethenteron reissneri]